MLEYNMRNWWVSFSVIGKSPYVSVTVVLEGLMYVSRCVWMSDVVWVMCGRINALCVDLTVFGGVISPAKDWETTPCCGVVTCLGHAPPMVL